MGNLARKGYRVTTPEASLAASRKFSKTDWTVLSVILVVSAAVRLYGLAWPPSVVFDEVHFGGFARKYVIGRFFFDVHPPLAKMLFAVVAFLGGYDGEFEFANIGDDYISAHVPYVTMRLLPALSGIITIALAFSTLRVSGCRTYTAAAAALLLTFENTHATESRYILLDSPLVLFVALSAYAFKKFELQIPFSKDWFRYLLLTGLALGATVSSKWVGLFTITWVGLLTIYQLWWIWGDLSVSVRKFWVGHFTVRAVLLLGVPIAFYVGMFWLHFLCVDNLGDGADFMPRVFQASLKHNKLPVDIPANVFVGSTVTLRHLDTEGGYLHSHPSPYETGSKQQQVTLYPHVDENNFWIIENGTEIESLEGLNSLQDGSIIRFMHPETQKRLHSHDHRAPVSTQEYINEVSGYGFEGFEGDPNDNWRVKIIGHKSTGDGKDKVQALRTKFQLEHTLTGCLLYSKNVRLPDWGFDQQEVGCISRGNERNTIWYIEDNEHPSLPDDTERVNYQPPSFLRKFIDINKVMWNVNKGLTDSHNWESRPESWLFLKRGINMWGQNHLQVYLVGNLPIYWAIAITAILLVAVKGLYLIYWQRYASADTPFSPTKPAWQLFDHHFNNYLLGWFVHYAPSFLMARQLFLHHYLGSVYFGVLMLGQTLELAVSVVRPRTLAKAIPVIAVTAAAIWYWWYSPLIYGKAWTKDVCERSKFADMDFDCDTFFESYDAYREQQQSLAQSMSNAKLGILQETPAPTELSQGGEAEVGEAYQRPDAPAAETISADGDYQEGEEVFSPTSGEEPESEPETVPVDDPEGTIDAGNVIIDAVETPATDAGVHYEDVVEPEQEVVEEPEATA